MKNTIFFALLALFLVFATNTNAQNRGRHGGGQRFDNRGGYNSGYNNNGYHNGYRGGGNYGYYNRRPATYCQPAPVMVYSGPGYYAPRPRYIPRPRIYVPRPGVNIHIGL